MYHPTGQFLHCSFFLSQRNDLHFVFLIHFDQPRNIICSINRYQKIHRYSIHVYCLHCSRLTATWWCSGPSRSGWTVDSAFLFRWLVESLSHKLLCDKDVCCVRLHPPSTTPLCHSFISQTFRPLSTSTDFDCFFFPNKHH